MSHAINKLTKVDTVALWHAVQAQDEIISLRLREGFTLEQMEPQRARLFAARAALRKVNQIRKTDTARGVEEHRRMTHE